MSNFLVEFVDDLVAEKSTTVDETQYVEVLVSTPVSSALLEIQEYLELPDSWISVRTAASDIQFTMMGELTVKIGDGKYPVHPGSWRISSVTAMVAIAPVGSSVILAVKANGVTFCTATLASGQTEATISAIDDSILTEGDFITVDVTQVGSPGTTGTTLVVSILLERI